jgi:hypothetical protein
VLIKIFSLKYEDVTKIIPTATMEEPSKRARPRKRWRDEVQEDLNIMGIKNRQTVARDRREWRKIVFEPRSTTECSNE